MLLLLLLLGGRPAKWSSSARETLRVRISTSLAPSARAEKVLRPFDLHGDFLLDKAPAAIGEPVPVPVLTPVPLGTMESTRGTASRKTARTKGISSEGVADTGGSEADGRPRRRR